MFNDSERLGSLPQERTCPAELRPPLPVCRKAERRMAHLLRKLLERRRRLLERIQAAEAETAEPAGVSGDPADMASSISARDVSYGIESVEADAVAQIDYVLRKISDGKYGICEECGKPIPTARLRAVPFACLCVACKEQEELQARVRGEEDSAELVDLAPLFDAQGCEEGEISLETLRGRMNR